MRIQFFQHVPFEGLAGIEPWLLHRGYAISGTQWWKGDPLPDIDAIDWLIVMGGPMGVYEESMYPWLHQEKRLISDAITGGKRVLGVCLGAQLIAEVLGARVYPHGHREIGWYGVKPTPPGTRSRWFQSFGDLSFPAFHWHGDTFDLPAGTVHLATSEACEHQAFSYGENVLALQFHIDSTRESINQLLLHCPDDLIPGPYVQHVDEIRNPSAGSFDRLSSSLSSVLEGFESEVEVR